MEALFVQNQLLAIRLSTEPAETRYSGKFLMYREDDMKTTILTALLSLAIIVLSGCATRTVVVPKHQHSHAKVNAHVVYHVKPRKRNCWRHRGHWDCR